MAGFAAARLLTQRGLSLIELMIALLLGALLTLGVTQIYLGSSTTYQLTDGLARVQENVRFATAFLARDIRQAGGRGCLLGSADVTDIRNQPVSNPWGVPLLGWEYNGTGIGDSYTLSEEVPAGSGDWSNNTGDAMPAAIAGNVLAGTDVLLVQGAQVHDLNGNLVTGLGGNAINLSGSSGIQAGTVMEIVSVDCSSAMRFYKNNNENASSITAGGSANQTGGSTPGITDPPMTDELSVSVFRSTAFYLGAGENGPALFRQFMEGPAPLPAAEEILGGVENMQVLYGVGNRDGAEEYVSADGVDDWHNVVSVRIALLMRSGNNVTEEAGSRKYNMLGLEVQTPTDRRVRLLATNTIGLRNRLE